jgi:hypothetical protein
MSKDGRLNHLVPESGIFPTHVLEVPPVQRQPREAQPQPKLHVGTLGSELLAHVRPHSRAISRSNVAPIVKPLGQLVVVPGCLP